MIKGKNIIKLLSVLGVLLVLFFVLKYTGDSSRSQSFRSKLVSIDPDEVTRVAIYTSDDSTFLELLDGKWLVNGAKPADSNAVKSMLSTLNQIEPSRLASRSQEQWKDFQVDASGQRVVVYDSDDKVLDIVLGRFNVEGQRSFYSYVRLWDEKDTYVAKNFMKMSISSGDDAYRVDEIIQVRKDSIDRIEFNYVDSAFTLSRSGGGWQVNETPADSAKTEGYLNDLRMVSSRSFQQNENYGAIFDITYLLKSGKSIQVTSYGDSRIGSSQNPTEFWQDPQVSETLFKGAGFFLGE